MVCHCYNHSSSHHHQDHHLSATCHSSCVLVASSSVTVAPSSSCLLIRRGTREEIECHRQCDEGGILFLIPHIVHDYGINLLMPLPCRLSSPWCRSNWVAFSFLSHTSTTKDDIDFISSLSFLCCSSLGREGLVVVVVPVG